MEKFLKLSPRRYTAHTFGLVEAAFLFGMVGPISDKQAPKMVLRVLREGLNALGIECFQAMLSNHGVVWEPDSNLRTRGPMVPGTFLYVLAGMIDPCLIGIRSQLLPSTPGDDLPA